MVFLYIDTIHKYIHSPIITATASNTNVGPSMKELQENDTVPTSTHSQHIKDVIIYHEEHLRTVASDGAIENSDKTPIRTRRVSTQVDVRRRSQSFINDQSQVQSRDRSTSQTTLDSVYGRLGKPSGANDRFEMPNPLLGDYVQTRKDIRHSQKDIETEKQKFESLAQSASHVDQVYFLEKRNTRVGRTSSVDIPSMIEYNHDVPQVTNDKPNEDQ